MDNIKQITPLGGNMPHSFDFEGFNILEVINCSLVVLCSRKDCETKLDKLFKKKFNIGLPSIAKSSFSDNLILRWIRQNTWLIEEPYSEIDKLEKKIKDNIGNFGSVVNQSDEWCLFDLTGPHCIKVLERLCNVDVERMAKGDISATRLEHLSCFIICKTEQVKYRIMGPRSAAGSLYHAIFTTAISAI
tara:strand:- start:1402 stop:1968 length:567 start_codon:yes stop_codon:yes gene_type:complete